MVGGVGVECTCPQEVEGGNLEPWANPKQLGNKRVCLYDCTLTHVMKQRRLQRLLFSQIFHLCLDKMIKELC